MPTPSPHLADPLDAWTVAAEWLERGHAVAMATVIATWGSSPRPPGSSMCIRADGTSAGSVSGGCVEASVIEIGRRVLESGEPELHSWGVTNEDAWEVGLSCGGTVDVRVEPLDPGHPFLPRAGDPSRPPGYVLGVGLDRPGIRIRCADGQPEPESPGPSEAPPALVAAAREALAADRSGIVEVEGGRVFLHVRRPPVRVVIVGAVHLAQHLAPLVRGAGYEVVVVDPRTAFASEERFPGVARVDEWPDAAFERLGLDRRTAVVTVTHDPRLDDPALRIALASDAFYVGALGSRRTHAARVDRLREAGVPASDLDRIRAPIGLDIGSRTPGEIAASILAEIVRDLRTGPSA